MVSSARLVQCPACGAGVAEGSRRCIHCGTPVATVRCASCFHMNTTGAAYCSGCGRDLGLEPIPGPGELECPDCRSLLAAIECGPGKLHDCERCGGQFLEHAALRDLIERHDRLDAGVSRARTAPIQVARVRYVACPVCRSMMNRRNFGGGSGVIVGVCRRHGTWFDAGELPRVLAFVESGGLARVRAQEREREAEHERLKQAADAAPLHALQCEGEEHGLAGVGNALVDFLTDLFEGFRRGG